MDGTTGRGPYRKGRERRRLILEAALTAYAGSGAAGPTLRAIAAEVGLSETAVLHYFTGRDELFAAVIRARDEASAEQGPEGQRLERWAGVIAGNARTPGLVRLFLEVADQLGYEGGKVRLVLNRADSALGIRVTDVEHSIGRKVDETIVSDGRSVVYALNRGVPFFLSNREAQVSQDILRLAKNVVGERAHVAPVAEADRKVAQKKSLFAWR